MTNTKFRKRALLSSVAMLLVALVALGSATFAWFSVRQDADASLLTATTTKSSTLTISQLNDNGWTNDLTFVNTAADANNTKKAVISGASLKPVSFDLSDWVTADAAGNNLGYKNADNLTPVTDPLSGFAAGAPVYVKYGLDDGDGDFDLGVSITLTSNSGLQTNNDLDYARVAIVPLLTDDPTVSVTVGSPIVVGTNNNDFSAAPATYNAAGMTPVTTGDNKTTVASTTTSNIYIGTIDEGEVYGFMVYAYYEGTDKECIDNYAGTNFTVALNFHQVAAPTGP